MLYQFKEKFGEFIREKLSGTTLAELQDKHGIRLVLGDANDPDDCGIVPWRIAFYVVGDLANFMYLLDDFWGHIAEKMATEKKCDVHVSMASDVSVDDTWENLAYPNYTLNEPQPSDKLPVSIFESPPCFGKRPATFAIDVHDASTVSIVISQVYAFRDRFEDMGIQGGRVGVTETSRGDYVRIMKDVDISSQEEKSRIVQVIEKVLRNLALRVLVDGEVEADSAVSKWLESLRERANMYFPAKAEAVQADA